ncbi:MAG TPA: hypothetical protein VJM33_11175 [Microthrixaceae bacterium]|nr:hypothetical protein [Microthrixaceae bacterium]
MIRILLTCALAALCSLAGCSDDVPDAGDVARPPSTPLPTVVVSSPTKDGATADPAKVALVVARLANPEGASTPLGEVGVRNFYRLRVRAMGLTSDEATCVADQLALAAGPDVDNFTIADVSREAIGVNPAALSQCLSPNRMAELANTVPDLSRVPAAELRELMVGMGTSGMAAVGLSTAEAACISEATVGPASDADIQRAYAGELQLNQYLPDAVASCLTESRIDELAAP